MKTSTALLTLAALALAAAILAPSLQHATDGAIDGIAAARTAREAELAKQEAVRTWQQAQQAQLDLQVATATADTAAAFAPIWQAMTLVFALALGGALVMLVYGLTTAAITATRLRATLIHADRDQVSAAYPLVTTPGGIVALPAPALASRREVTPALPAPITATPLLPIAGTWSELRSTFTPTADRLLLGVSLDGPVYGKLTDLLSILIVGRPGTGKTTLLRLLAEQAIEAGATVVAWDLHDDLRLTGVELCTTEADIAASAAAIMAELDARRRNGRGRVPIVVMVDELPLLARAVPEASTAMRRIVLEGRKFNVFGLIAGQGAPADLFDGGRLVRDATASRFVFRTSTAEARRAGLERVESLTTSTLPTGVCVLDGACVQRPTLVSIPRLDAPRLLPGSTSGASGTLPGSGSSMEALPGSGSSMAEAVNLVRSGHTPTAALRMAYGVNGGRRYADLRAELAAALGGQS